MDNNPPVIKIYTKPGCAMCMAAKEKMRLMDIPFTEQELAPCLAPTEGWRERQDYLYMAKASETGKVPGDIIPAFEIDNKIYTYTQAMKILKTRAKAKANEKGI